MATRRSSRLPTPGYSSDFLRRRRRGAPASGLLRAPVLSFHTHSLHYFSKHPTQLVWVVPHAPGTASTALPATACCREHRSALFAPRLFPGPENPKPTYSSTAIRLRCNWTVEMTGMPTAARARRQMPKTLSSRYSWRTAPAAPATPETPLLTSVFLSPSTAGLASARACVCLSLRASAKGMCV